MWDDASLRANGLASNPDPSPFDDAGAAAERAAAWACQRMVPEGIEGSATAGSKAAGSAPVSCQGQGQPEAAAERRVHLQRAEGEPWVAGYGCKPSAGMRPGLRAEESLLGGGQRRKQGMLPAMGP